MAKTVTLVKNFTETTSINASGAKLTIPADITANKVGTVKDYTFIGSGSEALDLTLDSTMAGHSWNIVGTAQADVLTAGNGNDTLVAQGADMLTGGSGSDLFYAAGATTDTITLTDYTYGEDFVYQAAADVANIVAGAANFTTAGLVETAKGNYSLASEATDGYYKVSVKNATGDATNVWFAGEAESTMNASSETKGAVMVGNNNGTTSDTIMGGAGQDTILAGAGDYAYGGSGNDTIEVKGHGASVVLSAVGGTDTVTGFASGKAGATGVDTVYLYDTTVDKASFQFVGGKAANGNVVVTDGTAKLNLMSAVSAQRDFAELAVKDSSGTTYNVAVAGAVTGNSTITVADGALYDYYVGAAGNKSAVTFAADADDLVVDLGNTGAFEDKATFSNILAVTGGKGSNTLIGAAATSETITAGTGASTLWGGAGAVSDTLVGSASGEADTFVYGEGEGNDVVKGFQTSKDRVVALSGYVASVERTSKDITIDWNDGGKLTFVTESGASVNDEVHVVVGSSEYVAKIGTTAAANDFTYDSAVQYYMGSTKTDTLSVKDSDNDQIWLGGSGDSNVVYSSIDNIDASAAQGSVVLAGNSSANKITGGVGSSSLWGGMGAVSDTLVGGTGTNSFYFGQGQGSDYITSSTASDKVVLYDVALSQISSAAVTNGSMVISLTDGSSLTLTSFGSNNKVTNFELADGSTWSYSTTNKTWTKA